MEVDGRPGGVAPVKRVATTIPTPMTNKIEWRLSIINLFRRFSWLVLFI
jgi:hypothetical protein